MEPAGGAWAAHTHAGAWEQHHSPSQELRLRDCANTCQTPLGGPARGPSAQGEAAAISSQALSPASRYDLQRLRECPVSVPGQPLPCPPGSLGQSLSACGTNRHLVPSSPVGLPLALANDHCLWALPHIYEPSLQWLRCPSPALATGPMCGEGQGLPCPHWASLGLCHLSLQACPDAFTYFQAVAHHFCLFHCCADMLFEV